MAWADARAALVAKFDGATVTATGYQAETLRCLDKPPAGRIDVSPIAYVIPPAREVVRYAGGLRRIAISQVRVRVELGADNIEEAADRMEAWVVKLADLVGDALNAEGTAGVVINTQEFSEFQEYGPEGGPPYGFDMVLGISLYDSETRSP